MPITENEAIFGLTLSTGPVPAAARFAFQRTDENTDAEGATFALLGGLEVSNETVTTGNIAGVAGKLHVCTIAGLTADRDLTLPSANVGERLGVYVADGFDTYELILKGAASQTINGGSAASEWSRVFIAGEVVIFRCIAANTWIVEYDGRIAMTFQAGLSANQTTNSADVWTVVNFDTVAAAPFGQRGGCYDTTNKRAKARRAGKWTFTACVLPYAGVSAGQRYRILFNHSVTGFVGSLDGLQIQTSGVVAVGGLAHVTGYTMAIDQTMEVQFQAQEANRGCAKANYNQFSGHETF